MPRKLSVSVYINVGGARFSRVRIDSTNFVKPHREYLKNEIAETIESAIKWADFLNKEEKR